MGQIAKLARSEMGQAIGLAVAARIDVCQNIHGQETDRHLGNERRCFFAVVYVDGRVVAHLQWSRHCGDLKTALPRRGRGQYLPDGIGLADVQMLAHHRLVRGLGGVDLKEKIGARLKHRV